MSGGFSSRYSGYFLLALFLSLPAGIYAQPETVRFTRLSTADGLSQNSVNCIFQDYRGFIWLGTNEGLNRYDGYHFRIYKYQSSDTSSLSNNKINKIYEDSDNNLWIGTADGLNLYLRSSDSFRVYRKDNSDSSSLIDNRIRDIFEDSKRRLWIATQGGLELFNPDSGSFRHFRHDPADSTTINHNVIFSIAEDRNNRLWFGTHLGLNRLVEKENRFIRYAPPTIASTGTTNFNVFTIHVNRTGEIWLGTLNGLYRYRPEQDDLEPVPMISNSGVTIPPAAVLSIADDSTGNIWLGTVSGLCRYECKIQRFGHFIHQIESPHSISNNYILSLFTDRMGLLWIGTTAGINKFDWRTSFFCYYRLPGGQQKNDSGSQVTDLVQDKEGNLWIGTNNGLYRKSSEADDFTLYNAAASKSALSNDNVYTLYCDREDNLWIGTANGLNKYLPRTGSFQRFNFGKNDLAGRRLNFIYSIVHSRDGKLWIGTFGGLMKFDPRDGSYQVYQHQENDPATLSNNAVSAVFEDSAGRLWLGTHDGLNLFDRSTGKFHTYRYDAANSNTLSSNYITVIDEDSLGRLWIGTSGGGLNRLDQQNGFINRYDENSGLPNSVIFNIFKDDSSYFWLTTIRGLIRFNPYVSKPFFRVYDMSDGLPSDEFTVNSGTVSRTGELYLGTREGFFYFLPRNIVQRKIAPPIVLTQFSLFNNPVTVGAAPVWEAAQISLNHSDNVLSFEFAALDYAVPHKNILAYKMEGFDKKWTTTTGNINFTTYTNLNPGTYTFRVKGANSDGVWNEQGTAIKLSIASPFWATWWFRLMIIAAILLLFRIRTASIRRHNRELHEINSRLNKEIRERQQAEAEIQQLNQQLEQRVLDRTQRLEEANKELEAFTISVSHDLRAPLRSIDSFSQILQEDYAGQLDASGQDFISRIRSSAIRMSGLINDILKLSRVARNEIRKEDVNLSHIAHSIITEFQSSYPERRVEVRIERDIMANCDPQMIRVVLQNLLENAWKFTGPKQQATIEFGCIPAGQPGIAGANHRNTYFIRDNGVGFDMKYYDKLFSPFQRLHKVSEYPGAGIGLAMVKRIITRHNGRVWGESTLDHGSSFYFQV